MTQNWQHTTLGAVCQKIQTVDPRKKPEEAFTYVDVSSVSNQTFAIEKTSQLLGREAPSRARRVIHSDDVIFATVRPTLMRVAQVPPELDGAVCSTGYIVLRPKSGLDARFLYYSLFQTEFLENVERLQTGASYPAVNDRQVLEQNISLPCLSEQKRIVAMLDQALTALDRARAQVTANLEDASRLLGACMAGIFSNEETVSRQEFGRVCKLEGGSQPPKSTFVGTERDGYIRLLQIRDFTSDDNAVYIPDGGRGRRCTENDILIARYGASVGQIHTGKAGTYNVALIKATPNEQYLNPDYFYFYLKSDLFQKPLLARSARGAQNGFNKGDVADIPVPIPAKDDQANIVDQLRGVDISAEQLLNHYEARLNELDALKQSLLDRAFSGELA